MYENVARSYQQTQYMTANPTKLILMCYEGAISNLKLARDSYGAKDYETKAKALQKTMDILHELNASLDMEKGGTIAVNLRALYAYMTQALVEADLKRNMAGFDHILKMLEELESGWREIASGNTGATEAPVLLKQPENVRNPGAVGHAWSV
jgi:flagellar protein FliS